MQNIILVKDNKVVAITYKMEIDAVVLRDDAHVPEIGDVYDPATDEFSKPEPEQHE